jgi:hypothetical protein
VYTFVTTSNFETGAGGTVNALRVYGFAPVAPANPVGVWSFTIGDTFLDGLAGVSESTVSNVTIALEDNAVPPSTTVNMTTDGTRTDVIAASSTPTWYLVTVPAATSPQFFEVFTGGDLVDAELGLYSTTGAVQDVDFDDGDDFNAALSYGAGSGQILGLTNGATGNGQDGVLAAGTYYLGVYAGEGAWYPTLWFVEPVTAGGAGNLTLTWRSGTRSVVVPSSTALGTNPNTTEAVTSGPTWYSFTANNISVASSTFLDIATTQTGLEDDTEIGVYRADGTLVASDDDSGPLNMSLLSWGVGAGPGSATGGVGGTGASLADGVYYLVAGGFNMDFSPSFFGITGGASDDFSVVVASGTRTVVQPSPVTDLGTDPNSTQAVTTGPAWYRFVSSDVGVFSGRFLDIATTQTGIEDDTEIGLYRNSGALVVSDDDGGPDFLSLLSFGSGAGVGSPTGGVGLNGGLAAGTYWLVAGSWNMTFANGFDITGGPGDDFSVVFAAGTGTAPGGTPPATIANLGTLGNSTITTTSAITAATVNWYQFTTPSVANTTSGRFVDVWTEAATTSPLATGDTEIGVYSANGYFATDDDDGAGLFGFSALSFGGGADRPASGDGVVFNGRDGAMPAGTYYVAVGEWNCVFAPSFVVTSEGEGAGNVLLKVASNFAPTITPCGPSDIAGPGPVAGADGELTADDIIFFITAFTNANLAVADIAGPGPTPGADGELTADDIILFVNRFTAFTQSGCP